jgi:hypothetical protein
LFSSYLDLWLSDLKNSWSRDIRNWNFRALSALTWGLLDGSAIMHNCLVLTKYSHIYQFKFLVPISYSPAPLPFLPFQLSPFFLSFPHFFDLFAIFPCLFPLFSFPESKKGKEPRNQVPRKVWKIEEGFGQIPCINVTMV